MIITKVQWLERNKMTKGKTIYVQSDIVTRWYFIFIPIFTSRNIFEANL